MKTGPVSKPILIGEPSELTKEDISSLAGATRSVASLSRIRKSHHDIARLAALGLSHVEIAAHTGYTSFRVHQLVNAPAMKELIAKYAQHVEKREQEKIDAYIELKTNNMIAAERHIADAIAEADEAGELLPIKTALAISADGADRLGYSKHTTNTNVNVNFGAALDAAIRRSRRPVVTQPEPPLIEQPRALRRA